MPVLNSGGGGGGCDVVKEDMEEVGFSSLNWKSTGSNGEEDVHRLADAETRTLAWEKWVGGGG